MLKWQPNPLTPVMNARLPLPRLFLPAGSVFRRTMPPPFRAGAEFQAAGAEFPLAGVEFRRAGAALQAAGAPPSGAGAEFQAAGEALRRPGWAPICSSGAPGGRSAAPISSSGAPGARGGAPVRQGESRPSAKSPALRVSTPRFLCR